MNFSPFASFAQTLSGTQVHLGGGKFPANMTAGGQVLGMISSGDGGMFLSGAQTPQLITLPITVSGKSDMDQQPQTIQIQVVNPTTAASAATGGKYVVPIQIQGFPQGAATVLTLAYNQTGPGEPLQLQLQPQLQAESNNNEEIQMKNEIDIDDKSTQTFKDEKADASEEEDVNAENDDVTMEQEEQEILPWQDCLGKMQNSMPLSLHHFLRFSADTIRREQALQADTEGETSVNTDDGISVTPATSTDEFPESILKKKKRSGKKKPPRPRKPRPGQVHIATALDGTTLFCCPECHMAYAEKEQLEQHLIGHKIERRFICDTCGAGLKRKEHLERHKLGHNPERPFICPICSKGFKRKEHLNLHSVIHSGSKSEVCNECGKGFYRKDHLRKHAKSHMTKKMKEAAQAQAQTILEAQQIAQQAQISVQIPNMPGLSVIPLGPSPIVPTPVSLATMHKDEDDVDFPSLTAVKIELEDDEDEMDDEDFLSPGDDDDGGQLPDVGDSNDDN